MGQSSGTETVTQNSEPWSQAQPYLQDIFRNSQSLYRQGQEYFPGSTVVPFSPLTERGMSGLEQQYSQSSPVGYQTASNTLQNVAGGAGNNPFIKNVQDAGAVQNDAGRGVLQSFASNGQQNPFLDAQFDRAAERVRDNTSAIFSKSGRYGSVAHQDQLSDSLGDMANNFYGQAYETDANRRFGAAEALGARQAGDINRNLGAQTTAAGLGQGANAQAMQAAGMMPMLHDYAGANYRGLMQLGGMREGMAGQQLQDAMNRWNFNQNGGWDLLDRYNRVVQPLAGLGGSSTGTQPSSGPSALQQGAGAAMLAASFFSDERLKEDVELIGERGGHKWYSYRYIWDEPGTRHEGVLAQDVEQSHPDAVETHPNGYKAVSYAALGLAPVFDPSYEARNRMARNIIERGTL
tara:strand:- start:3119 stop:4336 length:1218 start_codon:yes stop_codon:yes gene_type:complete